MCQIIEFSADYTVFSLHKSTLKSQVAFDFAVFWGNKQILFENSDEHRKKGFRFILYSALKWDEKKRRKLETQVSVCKNYKLQAEICHYLKVRWIHHDKTSYVFFIDKSPCRLWTIEWINVTQDILDTFLVCFKK